MTAGRITQATDLDHILGRTRPMHHPDDERAIATADRQDDLPTTVGWLAEQAQTLGKVVDALAGRLTPVLRPPGPRPGGDVMASPPEHFAPLQQDVVRLVEELRDVTARLRDLNDRVAL